MRISQRFEVTKPFLANHINEHLAETYSMKSLGTKYAFAREIKIINQTLCINPIEALFLGVGFAYFEKLLMDDTDPDFRQKIIAKLSGKDPNMLYQCVPNVTDMDENTFVKKYQEIYKETNDKKRVACFYELMQNQTNKERLISIVKKICSCSKKLAVEKEDLKEIPLNPISECKNMEYLNLLSMALHCVIVAYRDFGEEPAGIGAYGKTTLFSKPISLYLTISKQNLLKVTILYQKLYERVFEKLPEHFVEKVRQRKLLVHAHQIINEHNNAIYEKVRTGEVSMAKLKEHAERTKKKVLELFKIEGGEKMKNELWEALNNMIVPAEKGICKLGCGKPGMFKTSCGHWICNKCTEEILEKVKSNCGLSLSSIKCGCNKELTLDFFKTVDKSGELQTMLSKNQCKFCGGQGTVRNKSIESSCQHWYCNKCLALNVERAFFEEENCEINVQCPCGNFIHHQTLKDATQAIYRMASLQCTNKNNPKNPCFNLGEYKRNTKCTLNYYCQQCLQNLHIILAKERLDTITQIDAFKKQIQVEVLKKVLPNLYKEGLKIIFGSHFIKKSLITYYFSEDIADALSGIKSDTELKDSEEDSSEDESESCTISKKQINEYAKANPEFAYENYTITCAFCRKDGEVLLVNTPCGCTIGRSCLKKYFTYRKKNRKLLEVKGVNPIINCKCGGSVKPSLPFFDEPWEKFCEATFKCTLGKTCGEQVEFLNDFCKSYYCRKCVKNMLKNSAETNKKPIECLCGKDKKHYIPPKICYEVDIRTAYPIYAGCRLNGSKCCYLGEYINTCGCLYCRNCIKDAEKDAKCPCGPDFPLLSKEVKAQLGKFD